MEVLGKTLMHQRIMELKRIKPTVLSFLKRVLVGLETGMFIALIFFILYPKQIISGNFLLGFLFV